VRRIEIEGAISPRGAGEKSPSQDQLKGADQVAPEPANPFDMGARKVDDQQCNSIGTTNIYPATQHRQRHHTNQHDRSNRRYRRPPRHRALL
jgi:hypothetical protein